MAQPQRSNADRFFQHGRKRCPNFQRNCSVPGAGKSGRPLQVATPNCHRRKRRRRQGRQSHRRAGQLTEEEFLLHQKLKRGVVVKFKEVSLEGVGLIPITLPPIFFLDKEVFLTGVKKWERKKNEPRCLGHNEA